MAGGSLIVSRAEIPRTQVADLRYGPLVPKKYRRRIFRQDRLLSSFRFWYINQCHYPRKPLVVMLTIGQTRTKSLIADEVDFARDVSSRPKPEMGVFKPAFRIESIFDICLQRA
jgi:hypothetical protein